MVPADLFLVALPDFFVERQTPTGILFVGEITGEFPLEGKGTYKVSVGVAAQQNAANNIVIKNNIPLIPSHCPLISDY